MPLFRVRRPSRAVALAAAALTATVAVPSAAQGRASDAALLAAITAQAPATTAITVVDASPDGSQLAVQTSAKNAGDELAHGELWLTAGDASSVTPLESSPTGGSGSQYGGVGDVAWSGDGRTLIYAYYNSASKFSTAAHILRFTAGRPFTDQHVGVAATGWPTSNPAFTSDGRYVTFFGRSPSGPVASGAVDLASGAVLKYGRITYPARPDGSSEAPVYAPECARAKDPSWVPAQSGGRWMEQALSSPDPGCRFGANADDPGPVATPTPSPTPEATVAPTPEPTATPSPAPNVAGASDAPPSITQPAAGTGLVPISDRTKPLGPTLRIRSSAKGLPQALTRGLRVKLDVAGAQTLKAYVIVARPSDEKLFALAGGSTDYTIGRLALRNPASQTQTISIPLTKDAREILPRFLKITVTLRLIATDSAGNRTVVERQVPLTAF